MHYEAGPQTLCLHFIRCEWGSGVCANSSYGSALKWLSFFPLPFLYFLPFLFTLFVCELLRNVHLHQLYTSCLLGSELLNLLKRPDVEEIVSHLFSSAGISHEPRGSSCRHEHNMQNSTQTIT